MKKLRPERAGLHQERRRRHAAGRPGPGRRRHLLHRRRARDQGQGLRRRRSASRRKASARRPKAIALIKGAKNPEAGKKLIDWATSAGDAVQASPSTRSTSCRRIPDVKTEPSLAAVLKDAKIFPIDDDVCRRQPQAHRRALGRGSAAAAMTWHAGIAARWAPGSLRDPALLGAVAVLWLLLGAVRALSAGRAAGRAPSATTARFTLEPLLAAVADASTSRGVLQQPAARARCVGVLRHAARLPVRLHGGARRPAAALAARLLDAATLLPLDLAAVHDVDRLHLLVRAARASSPTTCSASTASASTASASTLARRDADLFPDRLSDAAADARRRSIRNLEEMAFSLGGSRWRVFRTVTLPLAVPGLANAFLLLFAASLADFATPLILAGNSFPGAADQAYLQITGLFDLKGGAVLSLLLLVPAPRRLSAAALLGRPPATTSRSPARPGQRSRIRSVAPWAAALLVAACVAGRAVHRSISTRCCSTPRSCVAFGANHSFTCAHYRVIFTEGLQAIRDTLIIAADRHAARRALRRAGRLSGRARGSFPGRQAMEIVSMINYALPGTIVGIAYLIAFNDPPLALTGTRADHRRLLRLPLQPDRHPRHRRAAAADRPQPRGGLVAASAPAAARPSAA